MTALRWSVLTGHPFSRTMMSDHDVYQRVKGPHEEDFALVSSRNSSAERPQVEPGWPFLSFPATTIYRLINDENYSPTIATLHKVATYFGVTVNDLYEEIKDKENNRMG